jgi:hypothetical protein
MVGGGKDRRHKPRLASPPLLPWRDGVGAGPSGPSPIEGKGVYPYRLSKR